MCEIICVVRPGRLGRAEPVGRGHTEAAQKRTGGGGEARGGEGRKGRAHKKIPRGRTNRVRVVVLGLLGLCQTFS